MNKIQALFETLNESKQKVKQIIKHFNKHNYVDSNEEEIIQYKILINLIESENLCKNLLEK